MTEHKPDIFKSNACPPCPADASTFDKLIYWLGIGLGSGLPRRAPGTWGTVGGLVVGVLAFIAFGLTTIVALIAIGLLIGNYICGRTSKLMNTPDDPHIVWDEWVGMWIALLPVFFLNAGYPLFSPLDPIFWLHVLGAFVLFRLFDVVKPFPISWADKKATGGFGIMLDDILAGIMAAIVYMGLIAVTVIAACGTKAC